MNLEQFHTYLLNFNNKLDPTKIYESDQIFQQMAQSNLPQLLEFLFSTINSYQDKSVYFALTLIGRIPSLVGPGILQIGDVNFHSTVQASLLGLIQSISDINDIKRISYSISSFASLYQGNWPSLFESLIGCITNPNPPSPLSQTIALECLCQCVKNESIPLVDENHQPNQYFQAILTILYQIFESSTNMNHYQMESAAQLAFSAYSVCPNESTSPLVIPIVKQIEKFDENNIDKYMLMLSSFSDSHIAFFEPIIGDFVPLLISLIQNRQSSVSQINALFILNNILQAQQFFHFLQPQAITFYNLFLTTIINESKDIDFDEFEGLSATNVISVVKDSVELLSKYFTDPSDFHAHVVTLLEECFTNNPTLQSIYANFVCYAYAFQGNPNYYHYDITEPEFQAIFQAGLLNEDNTIRCAAIDSLSIILESSDIELDSQPSQLISFLLEAFSKEPTEYIKTQIIKTLSFYLTNFVDFDEYINPIMTILSQSFTDSMTETQQIYALDCFYMISEYLGEKFTQYLGPIYQFIKGVICSYNPSQDFPINLFFKCVEIVTQFQYLPDECFQEISGPLLTLISQIDFLESYEHKDAVSKAICSILEKHPEVFFPFAGSILTKLNTIATSPLRYDRYDADDDKQDVNSQDSSVVKKRFPKTNEVRLYINSSIDSLNEGIKVFKVLLETADAITQVQGFIEMIINIIISNLNQDFIPPKIRYMINKLIIALYRSSVRNGFMMNLLNENGENPGIAFQIYHSQTQLISEALIELKTSCDSDDIDHVCDLIDLLTLSLLFLTFPIYRQNRAGKLSELSPIMNQSYAQVITETIQIAQFGYQIVNRLTYIDHQKPDLYGFTVNIPQLEQSISNLFIPLFAYASPFLPQELIAQMNETFKLQPIELPENSEKPAELFISQIVFAYWTHFLQLFPAATNQMAAEIIQSITQFLQPSTFASQSHSQAIITITSLVIGLNTQTAFNQNTAGIPALIPTILEFLNAYLSQPHPASSHSAIFENLLILAETMAKSQADPTLSLELLIKFMPLFIYSSQKIMDRHTCFALNDEEETLDDIHFIILRSVRALTNLVQLQIPIMQSIELKTTFLVLSSEMYGEVIFNLRTSTFSAKRIQQLKQLQLLLAKYIVSLISSEEQNQILENLNRLYPSNTFKEPIIRNITKAQKFLTNQLAKGQ